jgi:Tfp pilus assembly protein PilV
MRRGKSRSHRLAIRGQIGFALYEVMLGVAIFAFGVLALGRAVNNCLNASTLNAEDNRVRLILSNRMAEVQTRPGLPESSKEFTVDTGYGMVKLVQTSAPAGLTDEATGAQIPEIHRVTLTAKWTRAGVDQSQRIEFYVYRSG